jgi:hypothetical protein
MAVGIENDELRSSALELSLAVGEVQEEMR